MSKKDSLFLESGSPVNLLRYLIEYMNGINFYNIVRKISNHNGWKIIVGPYVNPNLQNPERFGLQLTDPDGNLLGRWLGSNHQKIVADPLAGPFYQLEIQKIELKQVSDWAHVCTQVKYNEQILKSMPILIQESVDVVLEQLKGNSLFITNNINTFVYRNSLYELV